MNDDEILYQDLFSLKRMKKELEKEITRLDKTIAKYELKLKESNKKEVK